eukprot:gene21751-16215_t
MLAGPAAVTTGGAAGIGHGIARRFVREGAGVIVADFDRERGAAVAAELIALGGRAQFVACDVTQRDQVFAAVDACVAAFGSVDILVNNAGAAWLAPFDEFPEKGWDKVMDVNVKGVFFLTQALIGPLRAAAVQRHRPSKVINVASVDGLFVNPQETYSYGASKAAVIMLTKRMALKLAPDQVMVSAIAPGAFPSDMNVAARDQGDAIAKTIPSGRVGVDEDM